MGEAQHTPTPWFAVNGGTAKEPMWSVKAARIAGQKPRHEVAICATGDSPQEMETANAAFIVAAVNSHATLTAALEEARGVLVASRSFVELVYEETDREEAADAKIVMGQTDAALATIDAALGRVEG